ncbi:DUF2752 domain-containing protein [Taibaiella soli]|uniref:DUF2752 domain-containing protein n=1 Tax=Taibaiella soli TaxID=1649169 RepID=A0A2W2AIR1_9BACT|nr:DUF2752 domain-containing protein [Taibaiella soli]PZF72120.1 DUF2752 domain-containing protein [Taibaiella soli]
MLHQYWKNIVHWLESHLLSCPFRRLTGIDCPGCGLQRSVISLLKGDIAVSLHQYPAGIFIVTLFLFLFLHLYFDFRHGALILKILFLIVVALIIANYFYKIFTHQLF